MVARIAVFFIETLQMLVIALGSILKGFGHNSKLRSSDA
jgi:hypothetical protein